MNKELRETKIDTICFTQFFITESYSSLIHTVCDIR